MKKWIVFILSIILTILSVGCDTKYVDTKAEEVPVDFGCAITVAQEEFNRTFSEFGNLKITETSTMARTASTDRVVIRFKYLSDNGGGIYGFELEKTATGSYDIIQQGENVTIYNLVREQ